jgi:hypothetical protein
MERILKLTARDFPPLTVAEAMPQILIYTKYYRDLKARMAETGINLVPVLVDKSGVPGRRNSLSNGHHRVKIAFELGHERMNITDDDDASGWSDELEDVII